MYAPTVPTDHVAGVLMALLVHGFVLAAARRLDRREGNVSVVHAAAQQEQVIETHILQRGGGDFDPRRVIHREAPVLAEREAPRAVVHDPTAVVLPRDAGAQDYMAAITGRRVTGRGNQDLAERMNRIAQMAASEQAADPTATGPGDPNGSAHGDTTDPAQATHGAATEIDRFLREHVQISTALTGSEARTLTFRIRINESGEITAAELVGSSGNDSLDGDVLGQAQRLANATTRIPTLTAEMIASVVNRNINIRVPIAALGH